jgi:hypothetical protein
VETANPLHACHARAGWSSRRTGQQAIPPEKIVQRLAEGLDAMDTILAKYKGKIGNHCLSRR